MEDKLIGEKFGRLQIIGRASDYVSPSGGKHKKYICKCDCGNIVQALKEHLISGRQKSCGCLKSLNGKKTHGEIHTRLYRIWGNMCNRCSNPSNPAWTNYGGRGIEVCESWKRYENFRDWAVESGYKGSLTLDRIDNDIGYEPKNCRWADNVTQANNKRNNHVIKYLGEERSIAMWASFLGIPYKTLYRRIVGLGWTVEKAFTQPIRVKSNKVPNT